MKYTPAGVGSVFATGFGGNGLAIDSANNVYVGAGNTIVKYTPGGVGSVFASTGLSGPEALAFDAAGNLYAANFSGNNIEKFTPGGVGSVFASNFNHPFGLAFDSAGNLYSENNSDGAGSTIWRFTPQGVISVFATRLTVGPRGLAFDSQGNLYAAISELDPNIAGPSAIQKFTPAGVASILTEAVNTPYFIAIIPEPSTIALLGLGLPALLAFRRRI
jgi:sugar lactone lactonase YvrE